MDDSNVQACAIRFIEDASYWIAALRERELHGIAAAMENLANERDALRAAQLHNRLVIAQHEEHLGRIQDELSESRSLLDEARITLVGIAGATARAWELPRSEFIDEFLPWAQSRARDTAAKIAAPVPAQPAFCDDCGALCTPANNAKSHIKRCAACQSAFVASLDSAITAQPAAAPEAVAKDAAPSCFTCIHCDKDDEDYPCRSCSMMSHWSSAAILSATDTEVKNG